MSQVSKSVLAAVGLVSLALIGGGVFAASADQNGIDLYSGELRLHGNNIVNAGTVDGVDLSSSPYVNKSGDTMSGDLNLSGNTVTDIGVLRGSSNGDPVPIGTSGGGGVMMFDKVLQNSGTGDHFYVSANGFVELESDADGSNGGPFTCTVDNLDGSFDCDGAKNWIHSLNSTHDAVYSSQESPQVRAVYEGNTSIVAGAVNVSLPRHFEKTVSDTKPMLRVQVTPHELATVAVTDRSDSWIIIEASEDVDVDFRVTGVREGYEDKQVVREKSAR